MTLDTLVSRIIESMQLKGSKKIGEASSRMEAVEKFEKFLKVQPGKYSKGNNPVLSENDFKQMRTEPRNAWVYSPDSTKKELPKELENHIGFWVLKVSVNEDDILKIYQNEIKGKFLKEEIVKKEEIEEKYKKWL